MQTAATSIAHELRVVWNNNLKFSSRFQTMRWSCVMFVAAVCMVFLLKLKWPKNKSVFKTNLYFWLCSYCLHSLPWPLLREKTYTFVYFP